METVRRNLAQIGENIDCSGPLEIFKTELMQNRMNEVTQMELHPAEFCDAKCFTVSLSNGSKTNEEKKKRIAENLAQNKRN